MFKQLLEYWPIIVFVAQATTIWACWSLRRLAQDEISKAVDKLEAADSLAAATVAEHGTRLTRAEGEIKEVRDDVHGQPTQADIARLTGAIEAVGREVGAVSNGVGRLEGYFLKLGIESAK